MPPETRNKKEIRQLLLFYINIFSTALIHKIISHLSRWMTYDYDLSFFTITSQPSSEKLAWTCILSRKKEQMRILPQVRFPHNICSACNANTNENWKKQAITRRYFEIFMVFGRLLDRWWLRCSEFADLATTFLFIVAIYMKVKKPTSASIQYSTVKYKKATCTKHIIWIPITLLLVRVNQVCSSRSTTALLLLFWSGQGEKKYESNSPHQMH